MSIYVALFILQGPGGEVYFLSPLSALEWCVNIKPGKQFLPEYIKADLRPFLSDTSERILNGADITSAAPDNEAAIFLAGLCRNFSSVIDASKYATSQGWILSEGNEYEGQVLERA